MEENQLIDECTAPTQTEDVPYSIVFNEDCVEGMKRYEDKYFDLAIVDPPYGINYGKLLKGKGDGNGGIDKNGWKSYGVFNWDEQIPKSEYWEQLFRVSKDQIIWGGNYFTEYLPPSMGWIMWDKGQRDFSLADGELAWTIFNKALRIFEMSRGKALARNNEQGGRFHPTQKPEMLYSWILNNYAKPNSKILDTHLGSGSSRIAAYKAGFNFIGFELDKEYYDKQEKRFKDFKSQLRMF